MLDRQHITQMFALHLKLHHSSFLSDKICIFQTPLCCCTYVHSHWLQKKRTSTSCISKSKFPVIKMRVFFLVYTESLMHSLVEKEAGITVCEYLKMTNVNAPINVKPAGGAGGGGQGMGWGFDGLCCPWGRAFN